MRVMLTVHKTTWSNVNCDKLFIKTKRRHRNRSNGKFDKLRRTDGIISYFLSRLFVEVFFTDLFDS